MNKLKTTQNGSTLCVFANVDKDISVHLANVDKTTNRIYTTLAGYEFICTEEFKSNHKFIIFEDEKESPEKSPYRKFNVAIKFNPSELLNIIRMFSREFEF